MAEEQRTSDRWKEFARSFYGVIERSLPLPVHQQKETNLRSIIEEDCYQYSREDCYQYSRVGYLENIHSANFYLTMLRLAVHIQNEGRMVCCWIICDVLLAVELFSCLMSHLFVSIFKLESLLSLDESDSVSCAQGADSQLSECFILYFQHRFLQ